MTHIIQVHRHGGSEVLNWENVELSDPETGELRLRQTAIGLNFVDVYFRTGLYPPGSLPFIPGLEAAGVSEAIGEGVSEFAVGDRVAYAGGPLGAYAEARNFPAERLIKLPYEISEKQAAALMLKGMTAEYLVCRTYPVKAGEILLLHAAAGGVGQILSQWATAIGAVVIGTVGSEEKGAVAKKSGCQHIINYRRENIVERVNQITAGNGVSVVYDSVGQATFQASLACLAPRGTLVSFGQSSGEVPLFDITELSRQGSLYLTRPTLFDYVKERQSLLRSAGALFNKISRGAIHVNIFNEYPLAEASRAHDDLEARQTQGSSIFSTLKAKIIFHAWTELTMRHLVAIIPFINPEPYKKTYRYL